MIYDKFTIALLTMLYNEEHDSANSQIARYLLAHAGAADELYVKELAAACHVGVGTVSRFASAVGFSSFAELKEAFIAYTRSFETVESAPERPASQELALRIAQGIALVERSLNRTLLSKLMQDLLSYERVLSFGLLKAEAAARDLQVDLLMQGKHVETSSSLGEQAELLAHAGANDLVVVFSYTGAYFDCFDLDSMLLRAGRPRIWMVCGGKREVPSYVHGCLRFASDGSQVAHPYQLQYVASLMAQEYARCER
ncbi:MAG: hypothetical protein Q4B54_10685 [Coriobacteriales bacterium]|nr:hypothetical protein [Coriobacteriales bacterium]